MSEQTETRGPGRPSNESLMARAIERQADLSERLVESQERLAKAQEQLAHNQPVREITFADAEYQARLKAEGFLTQLEAPAFQNGKDIEPRGLSPDTIHRLARLAPGKYCGGRVEVIVDNRDQRHLRYKSATPEERMRFYFEVGFDLNDIVGKMWAEMQQQPA
jgi:hypothetical protein